ncbi:MAG: hypothetical protein HYX73_02725 [Acidobacteria bacterium]|nr:hypothetical protein [Acidobacteriota bacterium]
MYEWGISPVLQLNKKISIDVDYKISDLTLPSGSSANHTIDGGFNYTFNKQLLTSTIFQYDSGNSFVRLHSRLNYIFRPDDDFFLIYSESRYVGGAQHGLQDRTLQAKVTYSFDF